MKTTRIFLVRHGHTELNSAEVVRGLLDGSLDYTGRLQAERLGRFLRKAGVNCVITSPLQRTRETAQAVASCCAVPVTVEHDLRDRDYGPWTGWPKSEVSERFGRVDNAPGIEPTAAFMRRVAIALARAVLAHRGHTLAVVGHTAVNRGIFGWFFPGWKGILPRIAQDAGCWNCIEVSDHRWELLAVNRLPTGWPQAMQPRIVVRSDVQLDVVGSAHLTVAPKAWPGQGSGAAGGFVDANYMHHRHRLKSGGN